MGKTLALCGFADHMATSEQLIPIIFKMVFTQEKTALCVPVHARKKYREKVVHLCRCSREEVNDGNVQ